jgi:2-haloacid dehalogenase
MVEFLLLDLDDTILDFHKAEHIALSKTLRTLGLEPTEEVLSRYSLINKAHWERLERKELTRPQVLLGRFETLFREYGIEVDPAKCASLYEENLSIGHYFLPGAEEALEALSKKYKLYLVSNGTARVQAGRLKSANISHFFEIIFVSQEVGADKPDITYFERVFARIEGFQKEKAIIVGDSLTSDIQGGINAGIRTCWVNPKGKPVINIVPDYQIESIAQLENLLETL